MMLIGNACLKAAGVLLDVCLYQLGEEHYNCISALHKSMRGSDDNAAIYWLVRMIEGGEDALFIARRLIVCASEDIGPSRTLSLNTTRRRASTSTR